MVSPDEDHVQARETVATLITDPEQRRSLLPAVVGMLDHEDPYLRLSAACGVCLAARSEADLVPYLIRRLLDRLQDDGPRGEAVLAFEYLASQFPEAVDEVLQAIREESDTDPLAAVPSGGFRRSDIYSPSMGSEGVGRTRIAGEGEPPGPQQVYSEEADRKEQDGPEYEDEDAPSPGEGDDESRADEPSGEERTADPQAESGDGAATPAETADVGGDATEAVPSDVLAAVLDGPVFDDITIQSTGTHRRFADSYRLLGIVGGREHAVSLRVFDQPSAGRPAFEARLRDALSTWQALDDDGVLRVFDWGIEPRPWAAVSFTAESLSDRDPLSLPVAVRHAHRITAAVERLHARDVVHGGLDPASIAYAGEGIDGSSPTAPRLDNVGVLDAFRFPFDPAAYLDPRYAAPEYFDPAYGGIDHATDIYQVGAVCYRLFARVAPFDVDPADARQHVLGRTPDPPSAHEERVPGVLDQIVGKAMAKQKLTRYETVAQMEQDLRQVRDQVSDDE